MISNSFAASPSLLSNCIFVKTSLSVKASNALLLRVHFRKTSFQARAPSTSVIFPVPAMTVDDPECEVWKAVPLDKLFR